MLHTADMSMDDIVGYTNDVRADDALLVVVPMRLHLSGTYMWRDAKRT